MDENKGTKKNVSLGAFLDIHPDKTNPFGSNRSAERLYRRAEKISIALHLATNHISVNEPVRKAIRTEAIHLLKCTLLLRGGMRSPESLPVSASLASIRNGISLVRMLGASGYLSLQNVSILTEALDDLGAYLSVSQNSPLSESKVFSKEDFTDAQTTVKDIRDKSLIKDNTQPTSFIRPIKTSNVREEAILNVLKKSEHLGIKDIASNLPEYSEKMIQRELVALIAVGKIKRDGLKRWSRYSIA